MKLICLIFGGLALACTAENGEVMHAEPPGEAYAAIVTHIRAKRTLHVSSPPEIRLSSVRPSGKRSGLSANALAALQDLGVALADSSEGLRADETRLSFGNASSVDPGRYRIEGEFCYVWSERIGDCEYHEYQVACIDAACEVRSEKWLSQEEIGVVEPKARD